MINVMTMIMRIISLNLTSLLLWPTSIVSDITSVVIISIVTLVVVIFIIARISLTAFISFCYYNQYVIVATSNSIVV